MSELHHEEQKRLLISWSGFFIDNLDRVHNLVDCFVCTSDNDQIKPAGKDYLNVKPVLPLCACVATMFQ